MHLFKNFLSKPKEEKAISLSINYKLIDLEYEKLDNYLLADKKPLECEILFFGKYREDIRNIIPFLLILDLCNVKTYNIRMSGKHSLSINEMKIPLTVIHKIIDYILKYNEDNSENESLKKLKKRYENEKFLIESTKANRILYDPKNNCMYKETDGEDAIDSKDFCLEILYYVTGMYSDIIEEVNSTQKSQSLKDVECYKFLDGTYFKANIMFFPSSSRGHVDFYVYNRRDKFLVGRTYNKIDKNDSLNSLYTVIFPDYLKGEKDENKG